MNIKTQAYYIPLRRRFLLYLLTNNITSFTTNEARRWYEQENKKVVPYGNLYVVLLKPLLFEGKIGRVDRGHWAVTAPLDSFSQHTNYELNQDQQATKDEHQDEWEAYIRQKLYTPDSQRDLEKSEEKE